MSKTKITLRISKDLIERVNIVARINEKSREEIVTDALQDHLTDLEDQEAFKEDIFDLYLDGQLSLETLNQFLDSRDPESARVSEALLEQAQEPDDNDMSQG